MNDENTLHWKGRIPVYFDPLKRERNPRGDLPSAAWMCHVSETHLPISSYSTTPRPFFFKLRTFLLLSLPYPKSAVTTTTRIRFQHSSLPTMSKQSTGKRVPCYWDGDDTAVAEILVQLLDLIPSHDYSKPSFAWGAKRKRSQPPSSSAAIETKSNVVVVAATSPATPLMFSPSESDDNNNKANTPNSHVSVSKRKLQNKDELMQSFTELTHQKDSLVKEMEAVKHHLDILRSSNLELKHRKQVKIIYGLSPSAQQTLHQQQQQFLHYPFQLQHPAIQWSTLSVRPVVNIAAPVGLPDLNLTLEEVAAAAAAAGNVEGGGYQGSSDGIMVLDYNVPNSRALASAQARKRRMQIYKEKSQNQILRQR